MADTQLYWRGALEKGIPEHHAVNLLDRKRKGCIFLSQDQEDGQNQ